MTWPEMKLSGETGNPRTWNGHGGRMGLGPNRTSLLPRISLAPGLTEEQLRAKQIERSTARALGALKRREAKAPKGPKPRRHKHHCPCLPAQECCRCKGEKCTKAPKSTARRAKRKPATSGKKVI